MIFEDEPVPGYPLPILPGHTSPGRFERVLRAGAVRGHQRTRAAGLGRPGGCLPARAHLRRLRRRHQRHRRQRRQLPHVEPRRLRAAHPRRLCAGHADLLPRQEPHRHPGRHPRRRGDGRVQHPVPHRRRRAGRRSPAGTAGVRSRLACRCWRPRARCATSTASCPAARSAPRRACCSGRPRTRSRSRIEWRAQRLAKKVAAGAQFIQTQYCYDVPLLQAVHAARRGPGAARARCSSWSASVPCRPPRRPSGSARTSPGVHIPDAVIERLRGASDQAPRAASCASNSSRKSASIKGVHGVHLMAYRQEESRRRDHRPSGVLGGRVPWHPGRDPQTNTDRKAS